MALQPLAVRAGQARPAERGAAMIVTLMAILIISTMVLAGVRFMIDMSKKSEQIFESKDQAYGVARAGIIDAISWFRRQIAQPVAAFAPQRNLAAVPPLNETDNQAIGLVRTYAITKSVWARYEVRLVNPADPFAMQDVTLARAIAGSAPGTVWEVKSTGYIFRRNFVDPNIAANPNNEWNEAMEWDAAKHQPSGTTADGLNQLVSSIRLATEIRRLPIIKPATAALCVRTASGINLGTKSKLAGVTKSGLAYLTGTGTPVIVTAPTGSPATYIAPAGAYADDWLNIFMMPLQDLVAMPDVKVKDVNDLPVPLPSYSFTYYNGNVTFDSVRPLRSAAAVLVVDGNLTIASNSNSSFNGFVYVRGNYIQQAPSSIRGMVVVRGTANVSGVGDNSEITYDPGLIDVLMQKMGQYRLSQAIRILDSQFVGTNQ